MREKNRPEEYSEKQVFGLVGSRQRILKEIDFGSNGPCFRVMGENARAEKMMKTHRFEWAGFSTANFYDTFYLFDHPHYEKIWVHEDQLISYGEKVKHGVSKP